MANIASSIQVPHQEKQQRLGPSPVEPLVLTVFFYKSTRYPLSCIAGPTARLSADSQPDARRSQALSLAATP